MLLALLALSSTALALSEPVFITDLLHDPAAARAATKVDPSVINLGVDSYSGFVRLPGPGPRRGMYFWYIEAQNKPETAPVSTWLQGGPGGSSLFGLFSENGPVTVDASGNLSPREYAWNRNVNMLYIDNPLGVGYSFVDGRSDTEGFCHDENCVAENMFEVLTQFFTVFNGVARNPFYFAGESYAGKYISSSAFYLHNQIVAGKSHINFKGLAIGDGALYPRTQMTVYSDLLYNVGLATTAEKKVIQAYEQSIRDKIDDKDYIGAFRVFDEMLNGDFYHDGTYIFNITQLADYFNWYLNAGPPEIPTSYLNSDEIREALHVGSYTWASYNATVETNLIGDWMRDVRYALPAVWENYNVVLYSGQVDLILGPTGTEQVISELAWNGQASFNTGKKTIWYETGDTTRNQPAGYVRQVNFSKSSFQHVVVRRAGHIAPASAPSSVFDMFERFIFGQGWN